MLDRMAELQKLWDDALVDAAKTRAGNGAAAKGEQREQHQSRKKVERDEQKRYNKRSKYSEAETLFLQWANGSSPAGETKQFVRFGKHQFYEKSVNGCVEITASQYAERRGVNHANDYRRAYHRIDAAAHNDGSEEKRDFRDRGSHGNNGDAQKFSRQTVGEKLRHDAGGSLSSVDRDGGRDNVKELSASSNEHLNTTGPKATSKELYATNILLDALRVKGDVALLVRIATRAIPEARRISEA